MRVFIDGKLIECKRLEILTPLMERILKILKKPMIQNKLLKELNKGSGYLDTVQSTLSRNLNRLALMGLVNYRLPNGRTKEFYLMNNTKEVKINE